MANFGALLFCANNIIYITQPSSHCTPARPPRTVRLPASTSSSPFPNHPPTRLSVILFSWSISASNDACAAPSRVESSCVGPKSNTVCQEIYIIALKSSIKIAMGSKRERVRDKERERENVLSNVDTCEGDNEIYIKICSFLHIYFMKPLKVRGNWPLKGII